MHDVDHVGQREALNGRYAASMTEDARHSHRDEPVKIPLDPEEALRALLEVDPDEEPEDGDAQSPADDT